jgi:hypothetical protein
MSVENDVDDRAKHDAKPHHRDQEKQVPHHRLALANVSNGQAGARLRARQPESIPANARPDRQRGAAVLVVSSQDEAQNGRAGSRPVKTTTRAQAITVGVIRDARDGRRGGKIAQEKIWRRSVRITQD